MNNSINYPNQQLPSYSGITINITNPNLTAPMSGNSYYIPQPNCNSCLPNNTTANNFAETPTTTQNKMTNPISAVPISPPCLFKEIGSIIRNKCSKIFSNEIIFSS